MCACRVPNAADIKVTLMSEDDKLVAMGELVSTEVITADIQDGLVDEDDGDSPVEQGPEATVGKNNLKTLVENETEPTFWQNMRHNQHSGRT